MYAKEHDKFCVNANIKFQNLTYKVCNKVILNSINGEFMSGQLVGILGSSGAGKSTLLNILAGLLREGVGGEILINGSPTKKKMFYKMSSYIMQEDILQPHITVMECMEVAANLKLGKRFEKFEIIDNIINIMNLRECIDTYTTKLSGGQRKRLCVAMELISHPSILYLDEPTTGLDNISMKKSIELFKTIAGRGATVICAIHQPSDLIFQIFDQVYFMSDGNCIYNGHPNKVVDFLHELKIYCPKTYNPSDFLIEFVHNSTENGTFLYQSIENGKTVHRSISVDSNCIEFNVSDAKSEPLKISEFTVSFWVQVWILMNRKLLQIWRNKLGLVIEGGHHILCSLAIGTLFYQKGQKAESLFESVRLFYGVSIYLLYSHGMPIILLFPFEINLIKREYFNRWYELNAYFTALTLAMLPLLIINVTVFCSIMYIMTGQPLEIERFFWFTLTCIIYAITSQGFAYVISTLWNPSNGACVGSAIAILLVLLSSYGTGFGELISSAMRIIMSLSFVYHAYVGFNISVFKDRDLIQCNEIFCLFRDPQLLLKTIGLEGQTIYEALACLVAFLILHRILAYLFLKERVKPDSRLFFLRS